MKKLLALMLALCILLPAGALAGAEGGEKRTFFLGIPFGAAQEETLDKLMEIVGKRPVYISGEEGRTAYYGMALGAQNREPFIGSPTYLQVRFDLRKGGGFNWAYLTYMDKGAAGANFVTESFQVDSIRGLTLADMLPGYVDLRAQVIEELGKPTQKATAYYVEDGKRVRLTYDDEGLPTFKSLVAASKGKGSFWVNESYGNMEFYLNVYLRETVTQAQFLYSMEMFYLPQ